MEIIRNPKIMQDTSRGHLLHSRTIGYVPTMGALHEGHLSLVRVSRAENNITVVSIFVNPAQFGPNEDFANYPRQVESDIEKLRKEDVDILFLPDNALMYPEGFSTTVEVRGLSEKMCGRFRPGHFKGVSTVVAKLIAVARPSRSYFGQKDFQQTVIVRQMVKDLHLDSEIVVCPTIREEDGLALSSRNAYLDKTQRIAATALYRCLMKGSSEISSGVRSGARVREAMNRVLADETQISAIDYASVYDPATLDEVDEIRGEVLLAVAVRMAATRLIDNILVRA